MSTDRRGVRDTSDIVARVRRGEPSLWVNPDRTGESACDIGPREIREADARLRRFAPFLAQTFSGPWHVPEVSHGGGRGIEERGVIDSPLCAAPALAAALGSSDRLFLKRDDSLPISGSIKARGGIYEVLAVAERLAIAAGFGVDGQVSGALFATPEVREVMARHTIAVGSTGNLGLSIGLMARALGLNATIHMSADARAWKKARLRSLGAEVVEYAGDYGLAVETGRAQAAADPMTHFVDDENSRDLFLGYAVAGTRFVDQIDAAGITVDDDHPLHVHLPCGVGGGPGGVAYGIHLALGPRAHHVHFWYAEPTTACCMLLALATGLGDRISVTDVGLDGRTAADGLAVGRASHLAWSATRHLVAGAYTVRDEEMFRLVRLAHRAEGISLEPSAAAGLAGMAALRAAKLDLSADATHVAWATGGSMVPQEEMERYLAE